MPENFNVSNYQFRRIIQNLLACEDHFQSFISGEELICIECLKNRHLPLLQYLVSECSSGVCKLIGERQKILDEILNLVNEVDHRVSEYTREEALKTLQKTRDLRKRLQANLKEEVPSEGHLAAFRETPFQIEIQG